MRARTVVLVGAVVALVSSGCGGAHVPPPPPVGATSTLPRVALLPLENLSARGDASDRVSRVLVGVLGETRTCQPVPPGDVDAVFMELRIRDANGVTRDRVAEVAGRLDAQWLMAGSVLEYGSVRTPEGEYPSVGVSLRLLDARDGRTAWSAMRVITGQDRESVFGMGRVRNLDQLTERLARELLAGFRLPTETPKTAGGSR